jgi:hypothetical protein
MESAEQFLLEQHAADLGKMPPVLMGVASAAIGFAFHETADRSLGWPLLLPLIAVLLWGISFAFGVRYFSHSARVTKANIGGNWAIRHDYEPGKKEADKLFETGNRRMAFAGAAQQWLLLLGAAAYLGGHIWFIIEKAQTPLS